MQVPYVMRESISNFRSGKRQSTGGSLTTHKQRDRNCAAHVTEVRKKIRSLYVRDRGV